MLRPHLRRFISFLPSLPAAPASRFQTAPLNPKSILPFLRIQHANFSSNPQSTEEDAIQIQDAQVKPEIPKSTEKIIGQQTSHEFQAKTKKILDIVARSLYSEREVFVRELISNASDALEKARHYSMSGNEIEEPELPLQIKLTTDEKDKILIIQDTGMGMTEEELIRNLGTIARSGSEEFVKNLDNTSEKNIIGQFGVGFYSAFMVSTHIEVFSRSAIPGSKGYCWTSEGHGSYEISEAEGVSRGTKIIIHLKDDALEFAQIPRLENIIQKYSNFVGFDILIGDEKVNTVRALWGLQPSKITEEEYKEFYQFVSHAFDEPLYRLHFNTDSPLPLNSLLFVPAKHQEKFGLGKQSPGISIFSKKVLIQARAPGVLPEWLRFVQGVVDSPEIPLSLSREHHKDILLLKRIGTLVTRKMLKLLSDEQKADPEKFEKFFDEHGQFLKEGICTDHQWKDQLSKLYLAESSSLEVGKKTNLDGYVSRMKPEQNEIYYLANPNRNFAEASPYYEGFKQKDLEVLFVYLPIDEFVLGAINEYAGKKIISIETSQVSDPAESSQNSDLVSWLKDVLKDRALSIKVTERLVSSPAFITDHESAAFRKMLKFVEPQKRSEVPRQDLKINPSHPLIKKLDAARITNPELAEEIAHQIMDNAMVVAGLHDDSRSLIPRINKILDAAAQSQL